MRRLPRMVCLARRSPQTDVLLTLLLAQGPQIKKPTCNLPGMSARVSAARNWARIAKVLFTALRVPTAFLAGNADCDCGRGIMRD
jgi:hypothetical protein